MSNDVKICEWCGTSFEKPANASGKQWASRRFCSIRCSAKQQANDKRKMLATKEEARMRIAMIALKHPANRAIVHPFMRPEPK